MSLVRLELRHVRNIAEATLTPSLSCNVIFGANASGKTSLLEAIHILGLARSFRTPHIKQVIQRGSEGLTVFGRRSRADGSEVALGIERTLRETRIRVAGKNVDRAAELARWLPVQVINPESHEVLEQGPRFRRQFLDWGVFHVEHGFIEAWRGYHRALRQRNAALRQDGPDGAITLWNDSLISHAAALSRARESYLDRLRPWLDDYVERLLGLPVEFQLLRGWSKDMSYEGALASGLKGDREAGFTRQGPHRADITMRVDGVRVQQSLSRGQQKLLVAAMRLAQVRLLGTLSPDRCLLLVDDLPAELDRERRGRLLALLGEVGAQVFVTSTERDLLDLSAWPECKLFHVEHGAVHEVV